MRTTLVKMTMALVFASPLSSPAWARQAVTPPATGSPSPAGATNPGAPTTPSNPSAINPNAPTTTSPSTSPTGTSPAPTVPSAAPTSPSGTTPTSPSQTTPNNPTTNGTPPSQPTQTPAPGGTQVGPNANPAQPGSPTGTQTGPKANPGQPGSTTGNQIGPKANPQQPGSTTGNQAGPNAAPANANGKIANTQQLTTRFDAQRTRLQSLTSAQMQSQLNLAEPQLQELQAVNKSFNAQMQKIVQGSSTNFEQSLRDYEALQGLLNLQLNGILSADQQKALGSKSGTAMGFLQE